MRRAPAEDEVEGQDDEFLFRLTRGADLLAKGDLEAARAALGRARELRPSDPQVLGLLGQSLYKLGRFDDAAELYELLVVESPIEAAARVNLGLANLRAKRYDAAVRELEIALDLNPEHKKAMGYLGLAHLEQGDVPRAREWFVRAGGEQMIAKCDELLALGRAQAPVVLAEAAEADMALPPEATPSAPEPAATPPPLPKPARLAGFATPAFAAPDGVAFALSEKFLTVAVSERGVLARAEGLLASQGDVLRAREWFVRAGGEQMIAKCDELLALGRAQAPVVLAEASRHDPEVLEVAATALPDPAPVPPPLPPPARLAGFAAAPLASPDGAPFALAPGFLTVVVARTDVLARAPGLLACGGAERLAPEMTRVRGRATEKPFGAGARAMLRASGEGALLFAAGAARHTVLELEG
ncbi:MAG: tetratricopeptide repeat protein, partial [Anaeromyxobacteraceae bacterium]